MSEAAEPEVKKKKKGKLPVIIALIAVLGGGGFFGMKMKGGGAKKKPAVELGEIVEMEEMLVNLSNQESYLRTKIALHLRKGYEGAKITPVIAAVEDAVLGVLKSKSPNDVAGTSTLPRLKREIAEEVNLVLNSVASEEHAKKEATTPETKGKDSEHEKGERKESAAAKPAKREHPDWESDEGPVLKVYFKALAVQ